jgi:Uma2 family endonuclease
MAEASSTSGLSIRADGLQLPMRARLAAPVSDEELWRFCRANPDLRVERTADGEIIIMPPIGSETGRRNFNLTTRLGVWAERDGTGIGFDSSAGFVLPNGAERSPDASWVRRERWEALSAEQQERFAPLCPDFVVELRSPSDRLAELVEKLEEYIDNGARLGWLIDPIDRRVHVFRPGRGVEMLDDPRSLSADPELPGFVLELERIF